ncbi:MAG: FAD-binding oxidoreductase [Alphaproteobacteria bacterium]|nr:FAD-binding oxidoreductase [Alphaproteobacteria bacterium]
MAESFDVVIAGGAAMGSSVAYHLAADPAFRGRVLVVEKDPSYRFCASALSASSIRQQFSTRINVAISLYGISFLRRADDLLAVEGQRPSLAPREDGYLFLATSEGRSVLAENHALQTEIGADILWHEPADLGARFPWLATEGVSAGCWGRSGEGWFDGYGLMMAFRAKARALGVAYRAGEVVDVVRAGNRVAAVVLADGSRIGCGAVVNCAGTGGRALAARAGIELPVHAKKRMVFTFKCRDELLGFPLLIDPSGVWVRPESDGYICGTAPPPDNDPDAVDFEVDHGFFDEAVWPVLAARVPAFEAIRPGRAWAGHYDMCLFDHNAFVGGAGEPANFYLANGFSGHGLQQSPAVGRGLAELIVHGRYVSLDLSPLGYERLRLGRPLIERNVV